MEQSSLKIIGTRVREIRQSQNITVEALAALTELEIFNIISIEDGIDETPISNLYKIAKVLKVPLKDVVKA